MSGLRFHLAISILFFFTQSAFAQSIDSLISLINSAENSEIKLNHTLSITPLLTEKGDYTLALQYAELGLELSQELKVEGKKAECYRLMGNIYWQQGIYPLAMENYLNALRLYEKTGNKKEIAATNNCIALVYLRQTNYPLALTNFHNSLKVYESLNDTVGLISTYNKIAGTLFFQQNYKQALEYSFKYIHLCELQNDSAGIADGYNNIGAIYTEQGDFQAGLNAFFRSLDITKNGGSQNDISITYLNISHIYQNLKQYDSAIAMTNKSLLIAKENNNKETIKSALSFLASLYYETGLYKEAYENTLSAESYKDSLMNEESLKQLGDLKTNYAVEKREIELKAEQDKEKAVFKTIIYAVLAGLVLLLVFTFFIVRAWQTTKKQKNVIEKQKQLVDEKNKNIEEKQEEIISSITYAKRLQDAILPPLDSIKSKFSDCFILYKPKDIVAGDFYWMESTGNMIYIAAADCTGHGVPGAMVSVVCSNALYRAVNEFDLAEPGKILDKVTELVLETFEKSNSDVKDGMDISLLAVNKTTNEILWCGANNPLWYILPENNMVTELKGDKQPVGKHEGRKPFTTHKINSETGSIFYLFSDGFPDQFGGEKSKKYMHKRLKQKLIELRVKGLSEQEYELEQELASWKGTLEQTDDITIIGIKI